MSLRLSRSLLPPREAPNRANGPAKVARVSLVLTPVQMFTGSDEVLLASAVREAISQALDGHPSDIALTELTEAGYQTDDGYSLAALVDAAQTPPMLSDRRVVVGRHLARFSTKDSVRLLLQYLADPMPSTALVLVWDKGPGFTRRVEAPPKPLTQALKAAGGVVTKTDVNSKSSAEFATKLLSEEGIKLGRPALRFLLEHLGEDLNRLPSLIKTLHSAFGSPVTLQIEDLVPFVGDPGGLPPWDLTNAIARGDIANAISVLQRMVGGGRHPMAILGNLITYFGRIAALEGSGARTEHEAAELLGFKGHRYPIKLAMQHADVIGSKRAKQAIALLAGADLDLRGTTSLDPAGVLEILVARLAVLSGVTRPS